MKKVFALILITNIILFCGCTDKTLYDVNYPKPVVIQPDEKTAYTINGYKDTTLSSEIQSSSSSAYDNSAYEGSNNTNSTYIGKYLGNINTKKFHKTTCSYIKKTDEANIKIFEDLNAALLDGYSSCKRCIGD